MVAVTENPILLQPDDENILIRRYMSFSKYLDLLSRRALFFPSIAALDDPFEGTFSEGTLREIRAMILAQEVNADEADKLIDRWRGILRDIRNRIYVSCWHASQAESAAMWRLYGFIGESICIVTTYKILRDALPPVCQIGKIRYMDFKVDHFEIN